MFKGSDNFSIKFVLLFGLVLVLALAACTPGITETEEPITAPETETPATEAPEIQETPLAPVGPPTVLIVSGDGYDRSVFSRLESLVEAKAADAGLQLVVLEGITPEMITPEVQVVIGVGANLDINGLAMSSPAVQFLAIGDATTNVANNVSLIGDPANDMRQQAFIASYLTALVSRDYKIAALLPSDHPDLDVLGESYILGGRYYCGICQPLFPPYNAFPQWRGLDSEPGEGAFRPMLTNLFDIGVDVVYVHQDLAEPDLFVYLNELGIKAIGDRSPDMLRNNWVATVTVDPVPALQELWPDLLAGNPGVQKSAGIRLIDVEMGLISEGRIRFFNEVAAELQAGMIAIEIVP